MVASSNYNEIVSLQKNEKKETLWIHQFFLKILKNFAWRKR